MKVASVGSGIIAAVLGVVIGVPVILFATMSMESNTVTTKATTFDPAKNGFIQGQVDYGKRNNPTG